MIDAKKMVITQLIWLSGYPKKSYFRAKKAENAIVPIAAAARWAAQAAAGATVVPPLQAL